jgi:hypothetical protein
MKTNYADYYTCVEVDHLRHGTVNDAVEEHLDTLSPELWPETLTVEGYVPDTDPDLDPAENVFEHDPAYDVEVNVLTWVWIHAQHWRSDPDVEAAIKRLRAEQNMDVGEEDQERIREADAMAMRCRV